MNKTHKIIDVVLCAVFLLTIAGFGLWVCVKAPDTLSVSERRELSSKPVLSLEAISSGKYFEDFEDYLLDQFPGRDGFRRLKAIAQYYVFRQTDNHGIVIKNGSAVQIQTPSEHGVKVFKKRINQLVEKQFSALENAHIYTTLIPDKMYFVRDEIGYPTMDYDALREDMASEEVAGEYIDIFDLLSIEDYYTTDSHWKQDKIIPAANRLLSGMETEVNEKTSIEDMTDKFYGVYYGQSALPLPPEKIKCVHSSVIDSAKVHRANMTSQYLEEAVMYVSEKLSENDPYDVFLGGACTVTVIENSLSESGRTLYLFSDSYGRSLAPLLTVGYDKIVVCDIRYINPSDIWRLVPLTDGCDILIAYSIATVDVSSELRTD